MFAGCHKAPVAGEDAATEAISKEASAKEATADGAKDAAPAEEGGEGVALTQEEVAKMGIVTADAAKIMHTSEVPGFGVVIAHDTIAAAVAELRTAEAMERQSRSALARSQRLTGTPGAMPTDTQETAERQATVDHAALDLATRRLSATFGLNPPWKNHDESPELAALASGDVKLVRVTFPLGSMAGSNPRTLRLAHIDSAQSGPGWHASSVWSAPADASVPGKSFFAMLRGSDAGEGERLMAWAPVGDAESGVEIPAAAAVISGGKYWCYVEAKTGTFVRTEFDPGAPTPDGYFVKDGLSAGDKIVVKSAGQLLARETNPSTAAE